MTPGRAYHRPCFDSTANGSLQVQNRAADADATVDGSGRKVRPKITNPTPPFGAHEEEVMARD